jgi:predicted GTPase
MKSYDSSLNLEEALKNPDTKHLAEWVLQHGDAVQQNAFLKPKYLKSQQNLTKIKIIQLRKQRNNLGLKDLLSVIVKDYPAEMPSIVLSKLTQFIIEEWEQLEKEERVFV